MSLRWLVWAGLLILITAGAAQADVDLEWRSDVAEVAMGEYVDFGLYAVANDGLDEGIVAMDAVVTWDADALELIEVLNDGPASWMLHGLLPDAGLDGLNNSLLDGNALFTGLGAIFTRPVATPDGLLVATFRFRAIDDTPVAYVACVPSMGNTSITRVFGTGDVNDNITGALGEGAMEVLFTPNLAVEGFPMIAGATQYVDVIGEIAGEATYGLSVLVELVPQDGAVGEVVFTPAPPVDVVQLADPWPAAGYFTPYDTDNTGSTLLNGSVDDNGLFVPGPVVFSDRLLRCPIVASEDARGRFDIVLATSVGDSGWEGLPTALFGGTIEVKAPLDANGDERVDLADYARLGECFTGPVGPAEPPAYDEDASLWCRAFDVDGDGDIDAEDFASFEYELTGPQ